MHIKNNRAISLIQCMMNDDSTSGTQQYRDLEMFFQCHWTLSVLMMLSQCPTYFWDIPGLVSCAFLATPIFLSFNSQNFYLPYPLCQAHDLHAHVHGCELWYDRCVAKRLLPGPSQALQVSSLVTSPHGSKVITESTFLHGGCSDSRRRTVFCHVRTWTPQLIPVAIYRGHLYCCIRHVA